MTTLDRIGIPLAIALAVTGVLYAITLTVVGAEAFITWDVSVLDRCEYLAALRVCAVVGAFMGLVASVVMFAEES